MIYSLVYSQKFKKQINKLDKSIQIRIISTLEKIREKPYFYINKLVDSNKFKLRIGDYRILLNIKNDKLQILIIQIGHRRNIYKI